MKAILDEMLAALSRGERVVLCSILASSGSVPRGAGAKMAVFEDDRVLGTIGGGAVERLSIQRAQDALKKGLAAAFGLLKSGGRLSVITFHSLEDRIVKQQMNKWCEGCTCPKDFPVCVCGKKPKVRLTPRKPILPSDEEIEENPRARSAKLRVCEKI